MDRRQTGNVHRATLNRTRDRCATFAEGAMMTTEPSERGTLRTILLACGILSSLLYVATDLLGGVSYEGYSFSAQTISELSAIGAPSKPLVGPLFLTYDVLLVAFGIGMMRETVARKRALRFAAFLLAGIGLIGLAMAPYSALHVRGAEWTISDTLHIVVTTVMVLSILLAVGFAAVTLGPRFLRYSFGTLLVLVVSLATIGVYGPRLAAQLPTPGLGIVERVNVYAYLLWVGVLAIGLLRQRAYRSAGTHGFVARGFEEVRAEFERNFAERGEIGAAVAAYWRGEKVVDLWGGRRMPDGDEPWNEDTMVVVMSTTKGLAAMTLAVANARGWLDYDTPVARYWPEFAQAGKGAITVRQLLAHEAGLVLLDERLTIDRMRDLDDVARLLARQRPAWPAGTRHGYHGMTLGLYMQELIRRVDPAHRTLGRFFRDEIAEPLGLDFYIGLPRDVPDTRLATFKPLSRFRALLALGHSTPELIKRVVAPGSLLRRSLAIPADIDYNDRRTLEVELPAGNGVGTARSIARAYSVFAEGGAEVGLTPETFARITTPPEANETKDEVLGVPSCFSLGFVRPGPGVAFGSSQRAFGGPGAGGSFGFADPDARLGYAYIMNKLDFWLIDDPREKALRDAMYRAIARLGERRRAEIEPPAMSAVG